MRLKVVCVTKCIYSDRKTCGNCAANSVLMTTGAEEPGGGGGGELDTARSTRTGLNSFIVKSLSLRILISLYSSALPIRSPFLSGSFCML